MQAFLQSVCLNYNIVKVSVPSAHGENPKRLPIDPFPKRLDIVQRVLNVFTGLVISFIIFAHYPSFPDPRAVAPQHTRRRPVLEGLLFYLVIYIKSAREISHKR